MPKVIPRTFSGEVDANGYPEDPGAWLKHYQYVTNTNRWDSDMKKIANIPLSFTSEAEIWYSIYKDWINEDQHTWVEFRDKFIELFCPVDYQEELEERL